MTTTLTAPITARQFISLMTAFIGKREISRYNAAERTGYYRLISVLADVQRYARYNEEDGIPAVVGLAASGIGWAIETGRINGATHMALKAMSVRDLLNLIYKVHTNCAHCGAMPAYLMSLNLQPTSSA